MGQSRAFRLLSAGGSRRAGRHICPVRRPSRSMADCRYCRAIKDVFLVSAEMADPIWNTSSFHITLVRAVATAAFDPSFYQT